MLVDFLRWTGFGFLVSATGLSILGAGAGEKSKLNTKIIIGLTLLFASIAFALFFLAFKIEPELKILVDNFRPA